MKRLRRTAVRRGRVFRNARRREPIRTSKLVPLWAIPWWVPSTLSALLLLNGFLWLAIWFHQTTASPAAPSAAEQSILIFADRPHVPLRASVSFDDWTTGSGEFNSVYISLIVEPGYEEDTVGFSVAVKGDNFRRPEQEFVPKIGDCSLEVDFYGDDVAPSCSDAKNLQDPPKYIPLAQTQVLSGTLVRKPNGILHTTFTIAATNGWTSAGSSRTAFALPNVGSGYRSSDWAPTKEDFDGKELFDPDLSQLTVDYRNLQSDEKLEIAAPEPSGDDDDLTWVQAGSNSFRAHGSTIVLGMQERQSNITFIIGVLAGLVPLIVGWVHTQLKQRALPKHSRRKTKE